MTLTEALKQGDLVRRKAWPWWQCLNNVAHEKDRVWAIHERPFYNCWENRVYWVDAIATDWEPLEDTP